MPIRCQSTHEIFMMNATRARSLRLAGLALLLTIGLVIVVLAQNGGLTGVVTAPATTTRTTATVNATTLCSGSPCFYFFRYGNGTMDHLTPLRATDAGGRQAVSETITGLVPGTRYAYQVCGLPASGLGLRCAGPHGGRASATFTTRASGADCIYTSNDVDALTAWSWTVGYFYACAMVYDNANPTWAAWEKPWFITSSAPAPRNDWQKWKTAPGAQRQLIITISPFPDNVTGTSWLAVCARGGYDGHASALARALVAAGLGDSVIRLAHEANDAASRFAVPDDPAGQRTWAQCWHHEAAAIKAVPGAQFLMDWTVNAYYRPLPLANWYPGDDVVDIIGIDAYDSGLPPSITSQPGAWNRIFGQSDGIETVRQFAARHGKPLSLPEWGLAGASDHGLGDDPTYIEGIALMMRSTPVAYQAYFLARSAGTLLTSPGSLSLLGYRAHFGGTGDLRGSPTITP
jgi:hypothetical protein